MGVLVANEIASAYVSLIVQAEGTKARVEKELGSVDADAAGGKIGDGLGKGITNKQAAIAGAVGGIFASLANMAAQSIGDLVGDAVAQSDSVDKFVQTLSFAGLDTSSIDAAKKATKEYADSTVYDLATIQNTTAQLASNGIDNYAELTEAAGNLNAVAGGNQSTFESVAQMMTQTAGQGKLTTENWNQLADAIPGASGVLQDALKEAGAYTGNFRDAMEKGEITADEFNDAIMAVGSDPIAQEAATSVSTMEGAVGNLQAVITGQLAEAFTVVKPFLTEFVAGIADFIANADVFIPVIGGLAAALLVALAPAIWAAITATWAFTVALLANPMTWLVIGVGLLVAAIIALAMNWDTVVAWITDVWGGFIGWVTGIIDGFVGWWNDVWAGVGAWITAVWLGIVTGVQGAWSTVSSWVQGAVGGFVSWWSSVWESVGDTISAVFGGIGDFIGGVWAGIVDGIRGYISTIIRLINGVIDGVNVLIGGAGALIGLDIAIPKIPMLANGGTITHSGSVIVGERGPELLNLPRGASVNPNIAAAGGPSTLVVVDADGQLIGRMRVEADSAVMSRASGSAVRFGGGSVSS